MRRELPGGYELDDNVERIDLDAVHRYLAEESYWAEGRQRDVVEDLIRGATRVIGLYHGDEQVGFARTFSDGYTLSYLADVYVLEEHRGKGLGVELVREAVEGSPFVHTRWLLHTRDAQGLYERFGFGPPSERLMERHAG